MTQPVPTLPQPTKRPWIGKRATNFEPKWLSIVASFSVVWITALLMFSWPLRPMDEDFTFSQEVQLLLDVQGTLQKFTGKTPTMDSIRDVMFGQAATGEAIRVAAVQIIDSNAKLKPLDEKATAEQIKERANGREIATVLQAAVDRWGEQEKEFNSYKRGFYIILALMCIGGPFIFFLIGGELFLRIAENAKAKKARLAEGAKRRRELLMQRAKEKR